jgi:predicted MFS family arabinose efflux permease
MEISDGSNRGTVMSSRFAITQLALIAGAAAGALISKFVGPAATYGVLGAGLVGLGLVAAILARERTQIVPATE